MTNLSYLKNVGLFVLLLSAISFSSCKKKGCTDPNALNYNAEAKADDGTCFYPSATKKATVLEYTATWCGPCGSWGSGDFHDILANNNGRVVGIALHASPSDPMFNSVSQAFQSNFAMSAWPNFWVGNDNLGTNTAIANSKITENINDPNVANAAVEFWISESTLHARAAIKFFETPSGEYYVGLYVIENGIPGGPSAGAYAQNGASSSTYTHDHVMRASFDSAPFGEKLDNALTAYATEKSIALNSNWNPDNIEVIAIIFKKNGTKYDYVNAVDGFERITIAD